MLWKHALTASLFTALLAPTPPGAVADESAFPVPRIVLDAKLARVFVLSECKRISGLTCRIAYNGKAQLPSRVYFTEQDASGRPLGRRVRLIYPRLRPGEKGWATFRLSSSDAARIHLDGEWKGPWQDPY